MGDVNTSKLANEQSGKQGLFVLLIGPSGVGKGTILKKLLKKHPEFHLPISATTRAERPGEAKTYTHISHAEFQEWIAAGKFLEWAVVHETDYYGTLVDEIIPYLERGDVVMRELDVQGFQSLKNHPEFAPGSGHHMLSIFIAPENTEQLIERMQNRAPMSEEEVERRVRSMEKELPVAKECDVTVLNRNGKLKQTLRIVEQAIEAARKRH